jgi:hypothetical protein
VREKGGRRRWRDTDRWNRYIERREEEMGEEMGGHRRGWGEKRDR